MLSGSIAMKLWSRRSSSSFSKLSKHFSCNVLMMFRDKSSEKRFTKGFNILSVILNRWFCRRFKISKLVRFWNAADSIVSILFPDKFNIFKLITFSNDRFWIVWMEFFDRSNSSRRTTSASRFDGKFLILLFDKLMFVNWSLYLKITSGSESK